MKTAIGIASGFLMVATTVGLMIGFVALMTRYNIGKTDFAIGAFLAIVMAVSAFLVVVKLS